MRDQWRDDPFDDELRAALEATVAELRGDFALHLLPALIRVKNRGTPLRGAERYGSDGAVRLRFADGTSVLARAEGRRGLAPAAVAMVRGASVVLTELRDDGVAIHAVLSWKGGHRTECVILGEDQAD